MEARDFEPKWDGGKKQPLKRKMSRDDFVDCVFAVSNGEMSRTQAGKKLRVAEQTFTKWMFQWVYYGIVPPDYLFKD